jgi:hypothetical protein
MDFEENLFVTIVLVVLFLAGVGICNLVGLGIMWMRDRTVRQKRLYGIGRVLSSGRQRNECKGTRGRGF